MLDRTFQKRSITEIDNILSQFSAMTNSLSLKLSSDFDNLKTTIEGISGSSALDLCIARTFLSRSEYKKVLRFYFKISTDYDSFFNSRHISISKEHFRRILILLKATISIPLFYGILIKKTSYFLFI